MVNPNTLTFHPVKFIEEVKARPGLYNSDHSVDRSERLELWKQVGAALFPEWDTYSKATAYDRVLQLQKKWRSIRDAYNRELRLRRADKSDGNRLRRVYRYYKRLTFLGGLDGVPVNVESEQEEDGDEDQKLLYPLHELQLRDGDVLPDDEESTTPPPPTPTHVKKNKRKKRKREESSGSIHATEEFEMPMPIFSSELTDSDCDGDKLFLMSFAPEMRQLPVHIKMWARAQIASIMQEAVSSHFNNTMPQSSTEQRFTIKRQHHDGPE